MSVKYLKSLIYPSGIISKNYKHYLKWSFLSNTIISIESILSTHSLLSAVGSNNTELEISINYIGKDIFGQLGSLIFIEKFGKKINNDPYKFIKYNVMPIQQAAIMIECITPLVNNFYFLFLGSIANIGKNISFTGTGAINAIIIQQLSKTSENNIGEIYAKLTIINTFASTLGMGIGLGIIAFIPDHYSRLPVVFLLGYLRYYTFMKCIQPFSFKKE